MNVAHHDHWTIVASLGKQPSAISGTAMRLALNA
jgi:hypothetical protein